jgi:hypothetical protein
LRGFSRSSKKFFRVLSRSKNDLFKPNFKPKFEPKSHEKALFTKPFGESPEVCRCQHNLIDDIFEPLDQFVSRTSSENIGKKNDFVFFSIFSFYFGRKSK